MSTTDLAIGTTTAAGPGHPGEWASLRLLNSYRLFVALVLLIAFFSPATAFGRAAPVVFYGFSAIYLVAGLLFALMLLQRRPSGGMQAYLHFYTDVIALSGAMYASGGAESGLGVLLIVPVAGAGILLPTRHALLYAALATLMALASEIIRHQGLGAAGADYPGAALLGAVLFATALLSALLARRSAQIAAIARQRMADIRQLSTLNDRIIQHMESGILVVGPDGAVKLANASAQALLDRGDIPYGTALADLAPGLARSLVSWQARPRAPLHPIEPDPDANRRLQPQFTDLGEIGTLVSLEDTAFVEEQLQQLKLASLGRLTASIAHEIRNPLGAISHSAQLLTEAEGLTAEDRRLVEIQLQHCGRINRIVEDVLVVSRRRSQPAVTIRLLDWLGGFVDELRPARGLTPERLAIRSSAPFPAATEVSFDPDQLRQVLTNLCDNGLQHGRRPDGGEVQIVLQPGSSAGGDPILDVTDDGMPIDHERMEEIFEPFYSTSRTGTGLGLFLARELCETNSARLRYLPGPRGNRFRITFEPGAPRTSAGEART